MHRRKIRVVVQAIVIATVTCISAPLGAAQTGSGQELLEDCKSSIQLKTQPEAYLLGKRSGAAEMVAAHRCLAFLDGVFRTTMLHQVMGTRPLFCTPAKGLPRGEVVNIYVEWATANAGKLAELRIITAVQAFRDAFPCK